MDVGLDGDGSGVDRRDVVQEDFSWSDGILLGVLGCSKLILRGLNLSGLVLRSASNSTSIPSRQVKKRVGVASISPRRGLIAKAGKLASPISCITQRLCSALNKSQPAIARKAEAKMSISTPSPSLVRPEVGCVPPITVKLPVRKPCQLGYPVQYTAEEAPEQEQPHEKHGNASFTLNHHSLSVGAALR